MQRVDLIVDGQVRNVRQRSDLPAFRERLLEVVGIAGRVEVVRSAPIHPPPVTPHPLAELAQHLVVFAQVTDDAADAYLRTPSHWRAAVTADPSYQSPQVERLIAAAIAQGRPPSPWCDCREPDGDPPGTPFRAAVAMQQRFGLAEPIGQAESVSEYQHAIAWGARIVLGNPSSLPARELAEATSLCIAGRLAFVGEVYRPDPLYSARGVPIVAGLFGVALDGGLYTPVAEYLARMPVSFASGFGVYHGAGLAPADWAQLR